MKKQIAILFTLALVFLCAAALADIDIDGTFPDPEFNEYVREYIDTDKNGVLSGSECADVTEIYGGRMGIKSLQGIEVFNNLKRVSICEDSVETADFSHNTGLTMISLTGCKLTSVTLGSLPNLYYLELYQNKPLTKLDVSKCNKLQEIKVQNCTLTTLALGSQPELTDLCCTGNKLTKLYLKKAPKLKYLNVLANSLTALDVTALPELETLQCQGNSLTTLDVSLNKKLKTLTCNDNNLTSVTLPKSGSLEVLWCMNNSTLTSLNLGSLKKLKEVRIRDTKITKLDISKCPLLDSLMTEGKCVDWGEYYTWVGSDSGKLDYDGNVVITYSGGIFNARVKKITLNKTESTLTRTADKLTPTVKLKATVEPADAMDKTVSWTSSDPAIAEVDAAGKVTGLKNGTVTVTCKAKDGSGVKATCKVTVKSVKVSEITLNKTSATLTRKAENLTPTVQLQVTSMLPENAAYQKVKWSSDSPEIAEVDGTGKVTGLKNGTAVITCKASDGGGAKATCKITVKSVKVSEITLNKTSVTLTRTADDLKPTVQLEATSILPENAAYPKVKWESDKPEVATVDAKTGLVTGLKYGTAIITCKASDGGGAKAACKVSVSNRRVSEITLNESSVTVTRTSEKPNPTVQLSVTSILPAEAASKNVKWSSDKPEIAKVDASGKVTVLKAGTAVITCKSTDGGASATCKVVAKYRKVTGITLNKTSASIKVGKTLQLKVTEITPADAMVKDVTWESGNTKIATVDKNGKVTAVKAGACEITCTSKDGGKFKVTCKITVK